jgi:hypothetical protein
VQPKGVCHWVVPRKHLWAASARAACECDMDQAGGEPVGRRAVSRRFSKVVEGRRRSSKVVEVCWSLSFVEVCLKFLEVSRRFSTLLTFQNEFVI